MSIVLANNAHSTLSSEVNSVSTVLYITDTSSFPSLDVDEYFYATVESTSGAYEIVKVTQVNSGSFDVERGQEGTIAIPFSAGARVEQRITAQTLSDYLLTGSDINDEPYGVSWNGDSTGAPSRNAVYDKIESIASGSVVSDTAYGSGWNAVTTIAPSKNAVYDKINSLAQANISGLTTADDVTFTNLSVLDTLSAAAGLVVGNVATTGVVIMDSPDIGGSPTIYWKRGGTTKWEATGSAADLWYLRNTALGTDALSFAVTDNAATFTGTVTVPDDAYAAGWNGNLTVPTKNAVYDKIQSLGVLSDGDKGDITVSASGATWTIDNNTVTLAKMATMATDSILGRATAATGNVEVLTALPWAYTGDVTRPADSNVQTIANSAVTYAKMQNAGALSVIGRSANSTGVLAGITGTNEQVLRISGSVLAFGTVNTNGITDNAVTLAKMATMATDSILGRATAATGNVEVLTALPWAFTGDVTRPADSNVLTIANDAVTYAKMQNVSAQYKILGRSTAGAGDVEELSTSANMVSLIASADYATARTNLGLTALATTTPGTGIATFLATPSSANLISAVTDETGTGALVFATSPTLVTPNLGVATATSIQAPPKISSETTGALTSASRNCIVQCSGGVTLPAAGMSDGDSILIDPRGTARTITRPAAHTMYINNTDSATGTTGAHNVVTAVYHGSSKWTIQGSVT